MHFPYAEACAEHVAVVCVAKRRRGVSVVAAWLVFGCILRMEPRYLCTQRVRVRERRIDGAQTVQLVATTSKGIAEEFRVASA